MTHDPAQNHRSEDWKEHALCKGMTDLFFGPATERPQRRAERVELAAAICAECPVAMACREAGRRGNEHGYWGGEDEVERAAAGFAPKSPSRRRVIEARESYRQAAERTTWEQTDGSGTQTREFSDLMTERRPDQ